MGKEDIFNYYIGGLTLISAMVSIALYSRTYLAGTQIKVLDELLQETRVIYEKSCTDGLLPADYRREAGGKLSQLEEVREELKVITYRAKNIVDECVASVKGLTKHIMRTSDLVKRLRSHLVTTSDKNKRLRIARAAAAQTDPGAVGATGNVQLCPTTTGCEAAVREDPLYPPMALSLSPPIPLFPLFDQTVNSTSDIENPLADTREGPVSQLQDTDSQSSTEILVDRSPSQPAQTWCWWSVFWMPSKPDKDIGCLPV